MKKYLKEIFKFLLVLIIILLGVYLIYSIHLNRLKENSKKYAMSDLISYKKNENRIEYEYSSDNFTEVKEEKISHKGKVNEEYKIYYPVQIDKKIPLIIWSGDNNSNYEEYEKSLKSLASYGFIVLSPSCKNIGDGKSTHEAIDLLEILSKDKNSSLYQKIDLDKIGLAGHGEGACEALNASYLKDNKSIKSIFLTSLPKMGTIENKFSISDKSNLSYDIRKVSHPIFITAGSGKIDSFYCPFEAVSEEINLINPKIEAHGALRKKYDNNLVNNYHPLGYMNAWFAYTLNKDTTAANAFIVNEELKNNPKWAFIKDNRNINK